MGAGAVGSATGGFMAKAGHEVVFIGRPPHTETVREHGLRISGIWGEHFTGKIPAYGSADEVPKMDFDMALVCVKSYDTARAAEQIKPFVGANTLVCAYQNGLGNAEILAEHYGWHRVAGARVIYGARIVEPGHVEITVIAAPTSLGVYHESAPAERVREIAAAMDASGVPTVFTDRIASVLWSKVAYNCALNPLSALLDVRYGRLGETPYTLSIMNEVIEELYAAGHAEGVALEPATAEGYRALFYEKLLPPTVAHYASMREDLRLGRRTEIDALNGAIVRYGERHGMECPVNRMLTRLIHAREMLAEKR
jgi:2-dehydropantoate 2-reductase